MGSRFVWQAVGMGVAFSDAIVYPMRALMGFQRSILEIVVDGAPCPLRMELLVVLRPVVMQLAARDKLGHISHGSGACGRVTDGCNRLRAWPL